jgi:GNAT superfamily N-acetyltransferase
MASPGPRLTFHPVTPARWPDLVALFGASGACEGCWCQFWKQSGVEYRAGRGQANRSAMSRSVKSGEIPGLLAYADGAPVGWVAVEPRSHFARLTRSRLLPVVDGRPTWAIPCFFVARGWRGRGLAGGLLAAAAAHARAAGAPAVEGYPVDPDRAMADASLYHGALSTFLKAGFTEVARQAPTRPVVLLELSRRPRAPRQRPRSSSRRS